MKNANKISIGIDAGSNNTLDITYQKVVTDSESFITLKQETQEIYFDVSKIDRVIEVLEYIKECSTNKTL